MPVAVGSGLQFERLRRCGTTLIRCRADGTVAIAILSRSILRRRQEDTALTRKGVTLKDVAAAANVSRATAARALNSYGYVGDETALRVIEAADALGYRANRVAQALRSGQLPIVGYLPGDIQ